MLWLLRYEPNTIDLSDQNELEYWFTILSEHLPDLVDKAVASEGGTDVARRKGDSFAHAFSAHLASSRSPSHGRSTVCQVFMNLSNMTYKLTQVDLADAQLDPGNIPTSINTLFQYLLMEEPAAYGKLGLANLLELREDCLREFQFVDAYRTIKQRENEASLAVLPDLLMELDSMSEENRLYSVIEGVLAANIFDWGSLTIDTKILTNRCLFPCCQVDDFDIFKERMLGSACKKPQPHRRALLFVDNSGADIVLGMLPLARELLRRGTEVS
ncbi:protein of unknown function DUF89 [Macleaya cordata]|uniref:Damage-control phosphatase ARMT1-like metal-binding domain-containing protein n=1 Tax=Macleaya cordata TaxID=56857 RepID=A0A200RDE5_MACCD|nr:protein of unknown function DUF89 [Macleaya cordata]